MAASDRVNVPVVLARDPETGVYVAECVTLRECLGRGATEKEAMARVAERARKLLADRKAREAPMFDEARIIFVEIVLDDE